MEYRNVLEDPASMRAMLEASGGRRDVPVIVEGGQVGIGYGGS